jgi:PhoH-like ATPase
MRKTYILDTNVLLHDPHSLTRFVGNDVVIPIDVIEEIDRFKHERTERGHNARDVSRMLDGMRNGTGLSDGINLDGDIILRVYWDEVLGRSRGPADLNILRAAQTIQGQAPDQPVVIVSKDINLRLRADAMGLRAEDYESDRVRPTELYPGAREWVWSRAEVDRLRADGERELPADHTGPPNEYVLIRSDEPSRPACWPASPVTSLAFAPSSNSKTAYAVLPRGTRSNTSRSTRSPTRTCGW